MAPLIPIILSNVIPLLFGKAEEYVEDKLEKTAGFTPGTKGLIRSKTAALATGAIGMKAIVLGLPLPTDTKLYIIAAMAGVEWLAAIYVRVKTKDPV